MGHTHSFLEIALSHLSYPFIKAYTESGIFPRGSTASTLPEARALPGIPHTTLVSSSWAIIHAPARLRVPAPFTRSQAELNGNEALLGNENFSTFYGMQDYPNSPYLS